MKKSNTGGIVLLVLGILAALGSIPNKLYEKLATGASLSDIITLLIIIAMIVGGIVLIIRGSKKND